MRGFGAPQVCFAYESHMDDIAKALGIDPLEMPLMNTLEEGSLSPTSQMLHSVVVKEIAAAGGRAFRLERKRVEVMKRRGDAASRACGIRSGSPLRQTRARRWSR